MKCVPPGQSISNVFVAARYEYFTGRQVVPETDRRGKWTQIGQGDSAFPQVAHSPLSPAGARVRVAHSCDVVR